MFLFNTKFRKDSFFSLLNNLNPLWKHLIIKYWSVDHIRTQFSIQLYHIGCSFWNGFYCSKFYSRNSSQAAKTVQVQRPGFYHLMYIFIFQMKKILRLFNSFQYQIEWKIDMVFKLSFYLLIYSYLHFLSFLPSSLFSICLSQLASMPFPFFHSYINISILYVLSTCYIYECIIFKWFCHILINKFE